MARIEGSDGPEWWFKEDGRENLGGRIDSGRVNQRGGDGAFGLMAEDYRLSLATTTWMIGTDIDKRGMVMREKWKEAGGLQDGLVEWGIEEGDWAKILDLRDTLYYNATEIEGGVMAECVMETETGETWWQWNNEELALRMTWETEEDVHQIELFFDERGVLRGYDFYLGEEEESSEIRKKILERGLNICRAAWREKVVPEITIIASVVREETQTEENEDNDWGEVDGMEKSEWMMAGGREAELAEAGITFEAWEMIVQWKEILESYKTNNSSWVGQRIMTVETVRGPVEIRWTGESNYMEIIPLDEPDCEVVAYFVFDLWEGLVDWGNGLENGEDLVEWLEEIREGWDEAEQVTIKELREEREEDETGEPIDIEVGRLSELPQTDGLTIMTDRERLSLDEIRIYLTPNAVYQVIAGRN